MTIKSDAAKTAALLRKGGWCQGQYEDHTGQHCVYGAMAAAMFPTKGIDESVQRAESSALARELERRLDPEDKYVSLVFYNDSLIDSPDTILAELDSIAAGN